MWWFLPYVREHTVCVLSSVQLFVTLWTITRQASLAMGLSRQEYWSGLPFPPPGDLPNPGIEPRSPALQAHSLPTESHGKPSLCRTSMQISHNYICIYMNTYIHLYLSTPIPALYMSPCVRAPFFCSSSSLLLVIYSTHDRIYVSILLSQFVSPSPSPTVSTSPLSMPVSSFILCK